MPQIGVSKHGQSFLLMFMALLLLTARSLITIDSRSLTVANARNQERYCLVHVKKPHQHQKATVRQA